MNYGQGIGFTSLAKQSGAPFTAASAHNGTSIDAAGKVVIGNGEFDPAQPAALTDNREINFNGHRLRYASNDDLNFLLFEVDRILMQDDNTNSRTTISNGSINLIETTQGTVGLPGIRLSNVNGDNRSILQDGLDIVVNGGGIPAGLFKISGQPANVGAISTPSVGSPGEWRLMQRQAGAVALDGTQYLEVEVDGVVYKLGIVT